jgi:hypothetical protein
MQKSKKNTQILKNKKNCTVQEAIERCKKLKQQKKGTWSFLVHQGFSNKEIEQIENALKGDKPSQHSQPKENTKDWVTGLKFTEKYVYNKEDDKYVMYLRAANGNVVLTGDVVRGIKENYSNWYGNDHTINEVCRNYKIPRNYLVEILRVLGVTHDSEPITDEQLKERDVVEVANDLLQKKKFQLHQEFQKASWKATEEAANKWAKFQEGVLDPFSNFISNWQPPEYTPVKYQNLCSSYGNKSLLVGLSDVHFGAKTNKNESYREKGYSSEKAAEYIKKYSKDIAKIVKDRNYGFDECVLTSLGDIIHTTGSGVTTKGTVLVHDCIKEEQFTIAFNSILFLINELLALFPKVRVESVKGNHNDFGDWVLFKALEAYYRTDDRISFDVFQADHGLFKVKSTLFIASHGYSAEYKGRLPSPGKGRESYIANLFLSKPEALIGVKQKVLLTADQHHLEMREYAEFEHYMLSTSVKGDKHSEAMGLNNIARQSCFVIDDKGVSEVVYSYVE